MPGQLFKLRLSNEDPNPISTNLCMVRLVIEAPERFSSLREGKCLRSREVKASSVILTEQETSKILVGLGRQ